ncbi:CDP-diacylglycerol--serine O-phosphatidyltransferase [Accumulibacter sp.]|uniref:CDP-diacylglycerol--serine O-phosphatidyltransferase n=1 Tax=Accumulibacter sp. TaxID=2053492 RepID=UPI0004B2F657|nr:CDP-diacylglycerol--serine O-phosphatidyltransferase [Accumulibacter sp.]HRF05352.1 CDP-diacylglycerol--serine O-phosphatidyltransferase [Accumulibacter sp.]
MKKILEYRSRTAVFLAALQRLRGRRDRPEGALDTLPCIPVPTECIVTLSGPEEFRERLLALIAAARGRILISTLYLQDDDAGREVLEALYAAKLARPALQIAVFVDWHRAQRGLIGKARSAGNAALYTEMAGRLGPGVPIYGVAVQKRELMGVMHLKGFVIDDEVLYSGGSINDIYLYWHQRYRLDRYHLIASRQVADSLAGLLMEVLQPHPAVCALDTASRPKTSSLRRAIANLRRTLAESNYVITAASAAASAPIGAGQVGVTPLLGLGRANPLNAVVLQLIERAERRLVIFTPYFNLPRPVRRAIDEKIRQRCQVSIIVGDKTANDYYIPTDLPFTTIGALPYLYEANLRRFCKTHQKAVDEGILDLYLWRHEKNSFHLKGLLVDDDYALLTGSNINPRAWRLDLENGLLIHDPQHYLRAQHEAELERILAHAQRLDHHRTLDAVDSYPAPVQRLLKRLARTRTDHLVNQLL